MNSIGSIYGTRYSVSSFVVERKEMVVPIKVKRRGITINRKCMVVEPLMGWYEIDGYRFIHPAFEKVLRAAVESAK